MQIPMLPRLCTLLMAYVALVSCSLDPTEAPSEGESPPAHPSDPAPDAAHVAASQQQAISSAGHGDDAEHTTPGSAPFASNQPHANEIVYGDQFPEVLKVDAVALDDNRWRFAVTVSSPYDSPQRYADAWRVLSVSGQELGKRVLLHDHASEQPFTRSDTLVIPAGTCLLYTSPSPRDLSTSRMPSSA